MCNLKRVALFPGTFDPFTLGHFSVVKRALPLFDKLIVAVGVNENKKNYFDVSERVQAINAIFAHEPRIEVSHYDILTIDYAAFCGASYIVRGVRSVADFEYERSIADINRQLSGIDTILFYTETQYAHISSSAVRELMRYGKPVDTFLPPLSPACSTKSKQ